MHILAIVPNFAPSTTINILPPLTYLHHEGHIDFEVFLENEVTPIQVANADIIVLCRNLEPTYKPIYELALQLAIPIIYDLDDDLWEPPVNTLAHQYYLHPARQRQFNWIVEHASLVRVHSPVLRELVRPHNANVELVWAAIDWSLIPSELPQLSLGPTKLVYAAQKDSGNHLFSHMQTDLLKILAHYGNKVELHLLGFNPPQLRQHPQIVLVPFENSFTDYFKKFTRAGYAIGLAPMPSERFYQCKTNIKYRDYAAAGAAGIYSAVPLYENTVIQGETGLLVSDNRWFDAIVSLLENPSQIEQIRQAARRDAASRYNMSTVAQLWLSDFAALPKRSPLETTIELPQNWWFTLPMNRTYRDTLRNTYHRLIPEQTRISIANWRLWLSQQLH